MCESWTIKKTERQRFDAFELWCWRRLLRVPWTARRSNQSILKESSPDYSLEGLMLKLKLQYFGHLIQRTNPLKGPWCWERLKAGEGADRGWAGWMVSPTWWTRVWINSGSWWWTGKPDVLQSMGSQRVGYDWVTELNWTPIILILFFFNVTAAIEDLVKAVNTFLREIPFCTDMHGLLPPHTPPSFNN